MKLPEALCGVKCTRLAFAKEINQIWPKLGTVRERISRWCRDLLRDQFRKLIYFAFSQCARGSKTANWTGFKGQLHKKLNSSLLCGGGEVKGSMRYLIAPDHTKMYALCVINYFGLASCGGVGVIASAAAAARERIWFFSNSRAAAIAASWIIFCYGISFPMHKWNHNLYIGEQQCSSCAYATCPFVYHAICVCISLKSKNQCARSVAQLNLYVKQHSDCFPQEVIRVRIHTHIFSVQTIVSREISRISAEGNEFNFFSDQSKAATEARNF